MQTNQGVMDMREMSEEDRRTIFCNNLDDRVTVDLLRELFLQAGPVAAVTRPLVRPRKKAGKKEADKDGGKKEADKDVGKKEADKYGGMESEKEAEVKKEREEDGGIEEGKQMGGNLHGTEGDLKKKGEKEDEVKKVGNGETTEVRVEGEGHSFEILRDKEEMVFHDDSPLFIVDKTGDVQLKIEHLVEEEDINKNCLICKRLEAVSESLKKAVVQASDTNKGGTIGSDDVSAVAHTKQLEGNCESNKEVDIQNTEVPVQIEENADIENNAASTLPKKRGKSRKGSADSSKATEPEAKSTPVHQPYAFVVYANEVSVEYALFLFQGTTLYGRPLAIRRRNPNGRAAAENKCVILQKSGELNQRNGRMTREEWEKKQGGHRHGKQQIPDDRRNDFNRAQEDRRHGFDGRGGHSNVFGKRNDSRNNYDVHQSHGNARGGMSRHETNYYNRSGSKFIHVEPFDQHCSDNYYPRHGAQNNGNERPRNEVNTGIRNYYNSRPGNNGSAGRKVPVLDTNRNTVGNNAFRQVQILKNPDRGNTHHGLNGAPHKSEREGRYPSEMEDKYQDKPSLNPTRAGGVLGFGRSDVVSLDSHPVGVPDVKSWYEPGTDFIDRIRTNSFPVKDKPVLANKNIRNTGYVNKNGTLPVVGNFDKSMRKPVSGMGYRFVINSANKVIRVPKEVRGVELKTVKPSVLPVIATQVFEATVSPGVVPRVVLETPVLPAVERKVVPSADRKFLPYSSMRHPGVP